jgi:maltooligosyltrehalose trehalohydrolase
LNHRTSFGALRTDEGVLFRVAAPSAQDVRLVLHDGPCAGEHVMRRSAGLGMFELSVRGASTGQLYEYKLDGGPARPDPASRFQPLGVHGPSAIVDPGAFEWSDHAWRGPARRHLVLYELHVGTFAGGGTFAAVRDRLAALKDIGITAIELMPVADFAGSRNWGYDGVALFAPSRAYGGPDDLRALVNTAHELGLAVVLDVVYNHLGPEGAYLTEFNPQYLIDRHETPWGRAVNLDGPGCQPVREFIIDNAIHWLREYHFDGLRLDATHALLDDGHQHFLVEFAAAVRREAGRSVLLFAEDYRNLATIITPEEQDGWGFDGVWADDFHHVVRRLVARDEHGYYADYEGTASELARTIRQGWLFTGQHSPYLRQPRGTDPSSVPMDRFVVCLQNHDQIGNRAFGDRLHHAVDAATWRAVSTLLLTLPMTPLLFMGQEWAASTPFQYFTDLEQDLGARVTEGRRREFRDFPEFRCEEARSRIPDPQRASTHAASRLNWDERDRPPHNHVLALYRELLALRRHPGLAASPSTHADAADAGPHAVVVRRPHDGHVFIVAAMLSRSGKVELRRLSEPPRAYHDLRLVLSTEDPRFCEDPGVIRVDRDVDGVTILFDRPGAVVLEASC